MKTELRLPGLRTDPIASYLSAIGVLRIVGTQADPGAAGWWHVDEFRLSTRLTREELVSFRIGLLAYSGHDSMEWRFWVLSKGQQGEHTHHRSEH